MVEVPISFQGKSGQTIYDLPEVSSVNETDVIQILRTSDGGYVSYKVPLAAIDWTWSGYNIFTGGAEFSTTSSYGTVVTMKGTNNDAGPIMRREWAPSTAPSDFDDIFLEQWYAKNDNGDTVGVFDMFVQWVDVSDNTEDARMGMQCIVGGTKGVTFYFGAGITANGATGGDQGAGTINAKGVYDDGVLLTCYVIEAAEAGEIDVSKWDGVVPQRVNDVAIHDDAGTIVGYKKVQEAPRGHFGARKFAQRLGGDEDPLDIDKYTKHWREKKHLTSMPNPENWKPHSTGEMIQRLWETVEIQAVHIAKLNERLAKIEGRKAK